MCDSGEGNVDSDIEIEVIRYMVHSPSNPKPCEHATTVHDVTCNGASIAMVPLFTNDN